MADDVLSCPRCTRSMDPGFVVGRSPGIRFKSSQDMVGDLGGILLTSGFFNHSADAFRCSECGTVVIPGTVPGSLDAAGDTP